MQAFFYWTCAVVFWTWIVFLILFFLIPPFRDWVVCLGANFSEKSDRHPQLIRFHKASVRAARNCEFMPRTSRPPTNRQLRYIDSLLAKRETEEWMENSHPATIEEASELIDDLLACPHVDGGYDHNTSPLHDERIQIQKSIDRNLRKKHRHNSLG